jgi:beta-galactosidase
MSPDIPITTNFMGFFKSLDYWKWAQHVDFVSDDSYPDPADPQSHIEAAMARDLMRSLGDGAPWILMEQSTSAVNWRRLNAAKPSGLMRALSLQALARGADGVMFFQWRQSIAGAEKFHSAMLPVQGPEHRIHQEVRALGAELKTLAGVAGSRVDPARVAIVFDWQSWWSVEQTALPTTIDYIEGIRVWYRDLYQRGVLVDFVRPGANVSAYELVVVPSLFVTATETLTSLADYAETGGKLLITHLTGITDENARFVDGGFLGSLSGVLGVRIEEFAPHDSGFAEVITIIGADVFAEHEDGPLLGEPLITHRSHQAGHAWYVAGDLNDSQRDRLMKRLLPGVPTDAIGRDGVELVRRGELTFAINFTENAALVPMVGERLVGPGEKDGFVRLERYDSVVWRSAGHGLVPIAEH